MEVVSRGFLRFSLQDKNSNVEQKSAWELWGAEGPGQCGGLKGLKSVAG